MTRPRYLFTVGLAVKTIALTALAIFTAAPLASAAAICLASTVVMFVLETLA